MKGFLLAAAAAFAVQQPPVFRTAVDLVEVDVVVHDKTGAFAGDLAIDDFELQENGVPQRLEQLYLHLSSAAQANGRSAQQASRAPAVAAPAARRTFVVVFDSEHMTPGGFKRTQEAALSLFDKSFVNGADFGGVVSDRRMVNNRLTSDREELFKALKNTRPSTKKNSRLLEEREFPRMSEIEAVRIKVNDDQKVRAAVIRRATEDDPNARMDFIESAVDVKTTDLSTQAQASTNQTLRVLLTLMDGLSRVGGRKTVLLMSEGFIADESWPLVQQAVDAAARSNTRLYTLDARGQNRGLGSLMDLSAPDADARLLQQMDFGADAMNSLAVDTGGFVVRNTNDFSRAVARIVDDSSNYYVLGYRPTTPQDGKFHRITVKVKRSGMAVRARRGYVATPRPSPVLTDTPAVEAGGAIETGSSRATETPPPVPTVPHVDADNAASTGLLEGRVTGAASSTGYRVRPDGGKHVEMLLKDQESDEAAHAGWEAYQRGDVAAARMSLALAAASPGAAPWVHYALGMADYATREYRDAASEWEKVRQAAPEFEPVYFDLVDSYLQLREHDQAARVLRTARERWPHDPDVFNAFGVVQTTRGALDDAVKAFQDAIAAAPGESTSYFNLGRALEIRYHRSRRYVQQLRSWVSNEHDRTGAIENYRRYLELGGPFAKDAQEGLSRLQWAPK
jgi:VWFA-related protein